MGAQLRSWGKSIQDTFDRGQKITDPEQIALLSNAWDKAESYDEDMAVLDPGFEEGVLLANLVCLKTWPRKEA